MRPSSHIGGGLRVYWLALSPRVIGSHSNSAWLPAGGEVVGHLKRLAGVQNGRDGGSSKRSIIERVAPWSRQLFILPPEGTLSVGF